MEILSTLGINWMLLLAQIVNFGIILFILTRFVYRPVLHLVDRRRELVKKSMEEVERIDAQMREVEEEKIRRLREADREAGAIVERANAEAERLRAEALEQTRRETAQIRAKAEKDLADEHARVYAEIQGKVTEVILHMTQKILRREFTDADQARLMKTLEKELPAMLS